MKQIVNDYYAPKLSEAQFTPCDTPEQYPKMGKCWKLSETAGKGYFWIYDTGKHFNIKIHDFYMNEDLLLDMSVPECLSVTYVENISGEELNPYRSLNCNVVKSYLGGYKPFKALIHKKIPIKTIGIEFVPEYYEYFLKEHYREQYQNPQDAFRSIYETSDFSQMVMLLNQIKNYGGEGLSAELFFEAKVAEALSLVFERHIKINSSKRKALSVQDKEMIKTVSTYINDHYADKISLNFLAKIACMGTTKLKNSFKAYNNCTITEYIQKRRIDQAEHFFAYTDLSIGQVAEAVGYSNAGQFAELFRKSKGILPGEYKRMISNK